MKNNKGISLISLITYMILTVLVLGMLALLTSNFRENINNLDQSSVQDIEFDKINVQMLKEVKNNNNFVNEAQTTTTKLVFTNGNTYSYNSIDKAIYLNNNIKLAENIETFSFNISKANNRQTITVTTKILEKQRVTQYITNECINHNYSGGVCTICGDTST